MGCGNCGNGGCGTLPAGCRNNGSCGTGGCNKLDVFDWLSGMESSNSSFNIIEVRFKNTRKEFFKNSEQIVLNVGDAVVVEAITGNDVGVVSLTGELVKFQLKKKGKRADARDFKKVYRKATDEDLEEWAASRKEEEPTMVKARKLVRELGLQMKISDVEFQADKKRATFYYIAEERIDFRELIKVMADSFKVRVEMRQIGSRQEAGRVGGIGSCGRELCCSSWLTDFRSVSTNAARYQQLSINPMKLAGQCGKLKCCLNYELDSYMDALKVFPDTRTKLRTKKGTAIHQKSDIFKGMMWYAYEDAMSEFIPLKVDRVNEVIGMNEKGKKVDDLSGFAFKVVEAKKDVTFENVVGQDDVTRFDKHKKKKGRPKRNQRKKKGGRPNEKNQKRGQK